MREVKRAERAEKDFREFMRTTATTGRAEELEHLVELKDHGDLTPEEYERAKAKVLAARTHHRYRGDQYRTAVPTCAVMRPVSLRWLRAVALVGRCGGTLDRCRTTASTKSPLASRKLTSMA
ncbi:Short C-terminal domain-containing protein [Streptomyces melanosporofaciens]|uniref:Short C-terminal domain-containing protein n=1 Tax=Streptomyces melanosporofaciens TaxID=67327 RepID=A0A1H5ACX1_STRMJ|nr:Short C-terminal domain-containing protein [Streptomyces melanosporofaciens]